MIRTRLVSAGFFGIAMLFPGEVHSQDFKLQPVVFAGVRSDGGSWSAQKEPVTLGGWGARADYRAGGVNIWAEMVFMRYWGIGHPPSDFSPEYGVSWDQQATHTGTEFDTDHSRMKFSWTVGNLEFEAGKFDRNWGPGLHSLTVSEKAPAFPQFGFKWKVRPDLRFEYFHGELFSSVPNPIYADLDTEVARTIYSERFVAAHRVEYDITPSWTVGGTEMVVYGDRSVELVYLMPFISFWSVEHYQQDTDNILLAFDVAYTHRSGLKWYLAFLMDEWDPAQTFSATDHNWFAWQTGIRGRDVFAAGDRVVVEGTWTDARIYKHRFEVNDFYTQGYPLGHWTGPHAQSLVVAYRFWYQGFQLQARVLAARRGALTEDLLTAKYRELPFDRFDGPTESLRQIDIMAAHPLPWGLWGAARVGSLNWTNPEYDPAQPDNSSSTVLSKLTVELSIYLNFSFPGYAATFFPD